MILPTRRTRRHVPNDAVNRPVLDHVRAMEPAPEPAPAGLRARVEAMRAVHKAGLEQDRATQRARPAKLEEVWRSAVQSTGCAVPPWTGKERGRMQDVVRTVPLPDPAIRWPDVMAWVAGSWGEATCLAVPFMLHARRHEDDDNEEWRDRREDLLRALPSLSLFLRYAGRYVDAYATLHHGAGFWPHEVERAEADQRAHAAFMERRAEAARVGYDNLPARHRTNEALDDLARQLAERGDEALQDLLAERDKWAALARQLRTDWGGDWRTHLAHAMARERRRQAEATRTPAERAELEAWAAAHSVGSYDPDMDDDDE